MGEQPKVDISHKPSPHSLGNRVLRVVWAAAYRLLFRPTPRLCHGWRRFLLRLFGARIGRGAHVYPTAKIWAPWNLTLGAFSTLAPDVDCCCVARISIGSHTTVSQYSFLCTASHEFEHPRMPLCSKPIVIGDQCWLAADVFVGPGVTIGAGTVVGARSSVFRDLPPGKLCLGSPARPFRDRVLREHGPEAAGTDAG